MNNAGIEKSPFEIETFAGFFLNLLLLRKFKFQNYFLMNIARSAMPMFCLVCSDPVLWRIDGLGNVLFTNNSFAGETKENFVEGSIKDIVLAKDGITIFAIGTDGMIYRY